MGEADLDNNDAHFEEMWQKYTQDISPEQNVEKDVKNLRQSTKKKKFHKKSLLPRNAAKQLASNLRLIENFLDMGDRR